MDEVDRSRNQRFHNFGIIIAFYFGVNFAKYISYKWNYLQLFITR